MRGKRRRGRLQLVVDMYGPQWQLLRGGVATGQMQQHGGIAAAAVRNDQSRTASGGRGCILY